MTIKAFRNLKTPQLIFGPDTLSGLYKLALIRQAQSVLVITGGNSFRGTERYPKIIRNLGDNHRSVFEYSVTAEPSPDLIDMICHEFGDKYIGAVVAIGGGSALDSGKAVSAMLPVNDSVKKYLEGVGTAIHPGYKIPFIAIPTTSGTGSEATANAVLSSVGVDGYKKSLRHDNFVPDVAILDPTLTYSCPPDITAAAGLDAFTQLVEGYVSTKATPLTDALALEGIRAIGSNLVSACSDGSQDPGCRGSLSYGAFLSGIVLANAGLGLVHGFASAVGGLFGIPHGAVCGTLQGEVLKVNLEQLMQAGVDGQAALKKYAEVGAALTGTDPHDVVGSCQRFYDLLSGWITSLNIPCLGAYGLIESDLPAIVAQTENKNNPVTVTPDQMLRILKARL